MEKNQRFPPILVAVARIIGLDAAVAFSVAARLWQLIAATGTVILMTQFFSGELQGYYYTIVSLLAIQGFLDLGLSGIIVLLSSHEWASLTTENGKVHGSAESRGKLAEIHRFGGRWYSYCAMAFMVLITPLGIFVLSNGDDVISLLDEDWLAPWVICVALNSASVLFVPRIAILEGCNQVVAVNRMRLSQSVTGSCCVWVSIATGLGLWTLVISNFVRLTWELRLVYQQYGPMLRELSSIPDAGHINWRTEIWPLQWRLAIQSVGGYFATWFIVPVTFRFQGEVLAGQIGLTWQLLTTIQSASLAWIQTRLPRFGALLASGNRRQLETEMFRAAIVSLGVFLGGIVAFFIAVYITPFFGLNLSSRFVSMRTMLFFSIGMAGWNLASAEQSYIRLFKIDPFLIISILSSSIVASAIWYFGSTSGPYGLSIAYCCVAWIYAIPVSTFILIRHRRAQAD